MRILLDESLPRPLGALLTGQSPSTVQELGWTSLKNGELLRRAAEQFDVLLTADPNLEPLVPDVLIVLESLQPKTLRRVGATRQR